MKDRLRDLIINKAFLEFDAHKQPVTKEAKLAVAAILWEMAFVDGRKSDTEFTEVIRLLDHEFHLMDEESGELVQVVDFLRRQSQQFPRFINDINENYDDQQKAKLIEMLWRVAEADGRLDEYEKEYIDFMRIQLGLGS